MVHEPGPRWYALLEVQSGIVSRAQALSAGFTRHAIASQFAARRWQRIRPGVLATFTGPLGRAHEEWAAVLAVGEGAAIAGASAAFRHGMLEAPPDGLHVSVPAERRAVSRRGTTVVRVRGARRIAGSPPVVSIEDALCDVARSWTVDALGAAVAAVIQRRLATPTSIARRVDARGRFEGSGLLRGLVDDAALGAHSALELRYLRDVERAHHLPPGVRQQRVRRAGRTAYRDVVYPAFGLVVELDGARFHDRPEQRRLDIARDNAAAAAGEVTLRYGWWAVAESPCEVAAQVSDALRARGWTGRPVGCRKCG